METRGHQLLRLYLEGRTHTDFARVAGLSKQQLSHLVRGRRRASFDVAYKLAQATGGYLRPSSWLQSAVGAEGGPACPP